MLFVVATLVCGFAALLALALFLSLLVSCVPAPPRAPISARLAVPLLSAALLAATALLPPATEHFEQGRDALVGALVELRAHASDVEASAAAFKNASFAASGAVARVAACAHCDEVGADDFCTSLAARSDLARQGRAFAEGNQHSSAKVEHAIQSVGDSLTWHKWAAMLPLFAVLLVSSASTWGAVRGKRALLMAVTLYSIVGWWMMCSMLSMEFAISVGMADACLDPLTTLLNETRRLAGGGDVAAQSLERDLEHYLVNCSSPDSLLEPLRNALGDVNTMASALGSPSKPLPPGCAGALAPAKGALEAARAAAQRGMQPFDGAAGCDKLQALFQRGVVDGLCTEMAAGTVGVLLAQLACLLLVFLLAVLLPAVWHAHAAPPLTLRRLARCLRSLCRRGRRRERPYLVDLLEEEANGPVGETPLLAEGSEPAREPELSGTRSEEAFEQQAANRDAEVVRSRSSPR